MYGWISGDTDFRLHPLPFAAKRALRIITVSKYLTFSISLKNNTLQRNSRKQNECIFVSLCLSLSRTMYIYRFADFRLSWLRALSPSLAGRGRRPTAAPTWWTAGSAITCPPTPRPSLLGKTTNNNR